MSLMRQSWWKVLCVLLLFYTLIASYIIQLHPGLLPNADNQIQGSQVVNVIGYNTHFSQASDNQSFLSSGTTRFCSDLVSVDSDTRMKVRFNLPDTLSKKSLNLFVNNEIDGTMMLQGAFFHNTAVIDTSRQRLGCEIDVKTEKSALYGFPFQPTIFETIRNLMFHVPMWFTMFLIMLISVIHSIRYLSNPIRKYDLRAESAARVGLLFAVLGLITGSIWARFTWGAWWVSDPQLNGAFVTFLIYAGYLVLRSGIADDMKRARVAAVFNIFAYVILFILLMILPKFTESLHPGKGGNPGFNTYDLNSSLRAVFYPAVLGWILLGVWIYKIHLRINTLRSKLYYNEK